MDMSVYANADVAADELAAARATAANPRDYPLADAAYVADDGEVARCVFRHNNAAGQTAALRESGYDVQPDRTRATQYAEYLFAYWQRQRD